MGRMDRRRIPVMKRETTGKREKEDGNVARLTLFDPMHDEQTFCNNLTERKRTRVKFLGQQSETLIDDMWPQAGEMRSLWKGTTEFWTNDMPQDDTWEPNRHHSHILPLFRSHLTRDSAAMFPLFQNPVASNEHGCRDSHLPVGSHTENAEEERRSVVFGCQNYTVCTAVTTMTPLMAQNLDDKGRNHGSQQVHTAGVDVRREEATFQPEYRGTICPEQSDRNSIPTGTDDGKDAPDHGIIGGEIGASRSIKTGQKKRLLGGIKKTKTYGKNGTKLSRRRNYRVTGTSQYSAPFSVRLPRLMCMQF